MSYHRSLICSCTTNHYFMAYWRSRQLVSRLFLLLFDVLLAPLDLSFVFVGASISTTIFETFSQVHLYLLILRIRIRLVGCYNVTMMYWKSGAGETSYFRVQASDFRFRVPGVIFQISDFGFQVSHFIFQLSDFIFHMSCLKFQL